MREYKFRGKSKEGWVYGDYIEDARTGKTYIATKKTEGIGGYIESGIPGVILVEVDRVTVGQGINLKDMTGKEIYEGDVIRKKWKFSVRIGFETSEIKTDKLMLDVDSKVVYEGGRFILEPLYEAYDYVKKWLESQGREGYLVERSIYTGDLYYRDITSYLNDSKVVGDIYMDKFNKNID